jgi:hypothetical protein
MFSSFLAVSKITYLKKKFHALGHSYGINKNQTTNKSLYKDVINHCSKTP